MWLPFPFPQCPSCKERWAYSYHRDCAKYGRIEFDPDRKECRCDACASSWPVRSTSFFCRCGHSFSALDVDGAIKDITATLSMFAIIVERDLQNAAAVRSAGESSLRKWIQRIANSIAGRLGTLLGNLAGTLARRLFRGWS